MASPLSGLVLEEFAPLYTACARAFRWSPREVDELEIWEIAEILDSLVPPEQRDKQRQSKAMTNDGKHFTGSELLRARVRHARGQGPKPEAMPMSGSDPILGGLR